MAYPGCVYGRLDLSILRVALPGPRWLVSLATSYFCGRLGWLFADSLFTGDRWGLYWFLFAEIIRS
jgi:hypothetical protein